MRSPAPSFRLIDWLSEFGGNLIGMVRPHLETLQLHDFSEFQHQLSAEFSGDVADQCPPGSLRFPISSGYINSKMNILHHDGSVVAQARLGDCVGT